MTDIEQKAREVYLQLAMCGTFQVAKAEGIIAAALQSAVADEREASKNLAEALNSIVYERETELDMMLCQYPKGTSENKAWHDGVEEAWHRFAIVKKFGKVALAEYRARGQKETA